eukprot:5636906-Pyramimonas_sp.AAC.1
MPAQRKALKKFGKKKKSVVATPASPAAPAALDSLFADQPAKKTKYTAPERVGKGQSVASSSCTKEPHPAAPCGKTAPVGKPLDARGMFQIFKKVAEAIPGTLVDGKLPETKDAKTLLQ